ncbi:MAG: hypothetical protein Greene071421_136 [Parcubacteria group bacterium Greene0714_21]|nr:MAG: hypothetical protein Greene041639_216 [Parcubacteria group bacterium Greene0416_39]TSC98539.1 MAG: hypothetical protein Greene101447_41 [Parcubacteria group bacterium Greene1014_47]TSD04300.1 MAG: hypothetical protein Greene071421_136 [Parcubacteria group bacterium Greene0714_21]
MNFTITDQLLLAYIIIGLVSLGIFIIAKNAKQ